MIAYLRFAQSGHEEYPALARGFKCFDDERSRALR
jgi:hypothetical protein